MAETDSGTLTDAVDALRVEVTGLRAEIQDLDISGRRTRRLIWRQWIVIVIVVLLAVGLGFVAVNARHTAQIASRNTENAYTACLKANSARATTRALWDSIFSQPPIQKLSPQEQAARDAQVAALRARIATSYADQDCSKLAPPSK